MEIPNDAKSLRGIKIDTTAPSTNDLLMYDGSEWHCTAYAGIDGDILDISGTPSNYTPNATSPAADVDDLWAHLLGIDDELGVAEAMVPTHESTYDHAGYDTHLAAAAPHTGHATTSHHATHEDGGSDEMDGDVLSVTWSGYANYTPNTTPAECDSSDDLTAHLAGIDSAIGSLGGGSGAHAGSHIDGGGDAIDGDKLEMSWTPTYIIPDTSPSEVDSTDDLTAVLAGIDNALILLGLIDVYLERSDSNTVSLGGVSGTSKLLWVADIAVDCSTPKTLDTDGAGEYVITGTTTVAKGGALSTLTTNDYNNYGIHYLYLCNQNSCWEFSGYDRKGQLIISAESPTEAGGYLASSGDGANARHVGWVILDSSRTMIEDYYLASAFNQPITLMLLSGDCQTGHSSSLGEGELSWVDNETAGDPRNSDYLLIPDGWTIQCTTRAIAYNSTANKSCYYRVYGDNGFECMGGTQKISTPDRGAGMMDGSAFDIISGDTVIYLKTQSGAQKVDGSSGTIKTSDMAHPTSQILRIPRR